MKKMHRKKQRKFIKSYFRKIHKNYLTKSKYLDDAFCGNCVKTFDREDQECIWDSCPFFSESYDYWEELQGYSCDKLAFEKNLSKAEIKELNFDCKRVRLINRQNKKFFRDLEMACTFKGRKNKRFYHKLVQKGQMPARFLGTHYYGDI